MFEKKEVVLSDYAKFHLALEGFDVYLNGSLLNRWELFAMGVSVATIFSKEINGFDPKPKEDVYGDVD